MKELIGAFTLEVFRPIVTLVFPGLWAVVPGLIAMLLRLDPARLFVFQHRNGSAITLVLVATCLGLILEDVGSRMEYRTWRGLSYKPERKPEENEAAYQECKALWQQYLRLSPERDPVGFSYIQSYVLRMKFEYDMAAACVPAALGTAFLPFEGWIRACVVAGIAGLAAYLYWEGGGSVVELNNTRIAMLVPAEKPAPQEYLVTFKASVDGLR